MKKIVGVIAIIILMMIEGIIIVTSYTNEMDNTVPEDYIAVFKGETGETVHTTYLYETKKKNKTTYKYINTISTFTGYDSGNWKEKVTKKGTLKKKTKIFEKAKKNKAYSYVKYIENDTVYTIEEFKEIWK